MNQVNRAHFETFRLSRQLLESKGTALFFSRLARDESDHRAAQVDLIARLETKAFRGAVDLLSQAVAHDPEAAVAVGFAAWGVPAVVEQPVLAGLLLVDDVRMLARDASVDGAVLVKCEIVPAHRTVSPVHVGRPADVGAGLAQGDFLFVCRSF